MYSITQSLIRIRSNTRPGTRQQTPRAIVLHFTANPGAGAINHYNYFNNGAGGRYASAHYFVDKENIIQTIPDNETAFHANERGTSKLSYLQGLTSSNGYKGNANSGSIGIEMCIEKDGSYHPETLKRTYWLVTYLQNKYKLGLDRVVRHYDITGKSCPGRYLTTSTWNAFKQQIPRTLGSVRPPEPQPTPGNGSLGLVEITEAGLSYKDREGTQKVKSLQLGQRFYYYGADEWWTDLGGELYPTRKLKFVTGPGYEEKASEIEAPKEENNQEEEKNFMNLSNTQATEFAALLKEAREKGLFTSDQHEKDVLAGIMDRDKAIYLVALIAAGKRYN